MRRVSFVFVLLSAALAVSCGGSKGRGIEALCARLIDCGVGISEHECLSSFGPMVLSDACLDAMFEAPCEEHNSAQPSYLGLCFDSCAVEGRDCDGDLIYICQGGIEIVLDCELVCQYQKNMEYTGVCSETGPNGEVSDSGQVCWCQ
ncbi:MAG: hypothetical protein JXR96_20305 [Deltaproteobacteria bacterium]|nr:hypothetical protein [Deltaproteobacteria bacterium]